MLLHLLIIGLVLCPQADTLKCMDCSEGNCSEKQCPVEKNVCRATTSKFYPGDSTAHRDCAAPEECFQYSAQILEHRVVITTECCRSNLCNNKDAPDPPEAAPNGLKCFTCGIEEEDCTKTLNCVGDEDHCMEVIDMKKTLKGCSSKSYCSLNLGQATSNFTITCCQGDYCNAANAQSASLLLLVTMLMPVYFLFI